MSKCSNFHPVLIVWFALLRQIYIVVCDIYVHKLVVLYFLFFFVGSQYITIERWNPSQVFSENAAIHRELPSRVTVFAFRQTCCLLEVFLNSTTKISSCLILSPILRHYSDLEINNAGYGCFVHLHSTLNIFFLE